MSEVTAEMIERGRGSRQTQQRRRTTSRLRETREKLTSAGTGARSSDIELIRQYAQSRVTASPAMLALALFIGGVAALWVPALNVTLWIALVFCSTAIAFRFARNLLKVDDSTLDPRVWQKRFVIIDAMQGFVWALLVVLMMHVTDHNAQSFVFFVLLLVAAMNALMAAPIPTAVHAGLVPLTIATILFLQFGATRSTPLTLMAVAAQVYFFVLANRLYSVSLSSVQLRMEKDSLIAELEQAKANSDEARRRAEEASIAKSRFLATMSHELRTPLNAILGFSEVMKGELFGPHVVTAYKDYAADINASGQHLLALINEILDLSRVEAGRYELKEDAISLPHIVEDCQHLLSLRAEKRGITVTDIIESDLPRLWADERAVRQVTLNLLTNAIKFTPQGGEIYIKVGWTATGGQYLSIRDTGTGIPPEEIPVVLSSFGRGSMAQKNADEGSGLGLPIVKGLVELHGGSFTLRSEVRVGTEVIVIFPSERVMDALPALDPNRPPERERDRSRDRSSRRAAA